jgi:fibronectin type 3 domain-containing protein
VANLSFVSNATNSPTMESLSGSGFASVSHTVSLSWSASPSPGVVGYNVYRADVSGGPYVHLASMDAGPNYTDNAVSSGQTYFYVVTAVDGGGSESAYSNQAQVVVPTP